jgi:hypothetical protein
MRTSSLRGSNALFASRAPPLGYWSVPVRTPLPGLIPLFSTHHEGRYPDDLYSFMRGR